MNLLEVKNICKTYGSGETAVKALKDVSFSVPKGEYVAVVGESGSGKSTLLNMIGALDTPTTGKVLIDGKDIFAMDERKLTVFRRRNIGFIFQAFNLVPELTVEQNIIFPVLLDYQKPDKKYLEELLAVLNLKERRNHLPSQLSGGQQQRVAIGRALITRPDVVVCDEPVSALDASVQAQTLNLLREVQEQFGPAYLFISHDLAVVGFLCRHIMVMYLGQIVEEAPTESLFEGAAHPYTQALMAAMPTGSRRGEPIAALEGELPSPLAPPAGCRFHPRCPKAKDICRQQAPQWKEMGPGWRVRCWLA